MEYSSVRPGDRHVLIELVSDGRIPDVCNRRDRSKWAHEPRAGLVRPDVRVWIHRKPNRLTTVLSAVSASAGDFQPPVERGLTYIYDLSTMSRPTKKRPPKQRSFAQIAGHDNGRVTPVRNRFPA